MRYKEVEFSILKGTIITSIEGGKDSDELIFHLMDGRKFKMFHEQSCCENVAIEDICGEFEWLLDSPILIAEERTNEENPLNPDYKEYGDFMWTFYEIATLKGAVTIRWYGSSNGYYSIAVSFVELGEDNMQSEVSLDDLNIIIQCMDALEVEYGPGNWELIHRLKLALVEGE